MRPKLDIATAHSLESVMTIRPVAPKGGDRDRAAHTLMMSRDLQPLRRKPWNREQPAPRCFVKLDQAKVLPLDARTLSAMGRKDRAWSSASRIDRRNAYERCR